MKHILEKISDIMSHGSGVVAWVVCTLSGLLSGYEGMFFLLFFCVVVDAVWGISNAVHAGRFILSDLMRDTVGKILSYCSVFLVIIGIEKILHIESGICSAIVVGVIALTEVWSICGHILIRFPNLLFFRLLKPALIGEIARKLHIEETEVEEILNEKNNGNKGKKTLQKSDYTIGKMYIDGQYFCDTVEDTDRDISYITPLPIIKGVKVYGKTAIPMGMYNVSLTYSTKFRKVLPLIENVKGFDGVRIHSGNTAEDSLGCIIVGENKIKGGVINSRAAMERLMSQLRGQANIWITIE